MTHARLPSAPKCLLVCGALHATRENPACNEGEGGKGREGDLVGKCRVNSWPRLRHTGGAGTQPLVPWSTHRDAHHSFIYIHTSARQEQSCHLPPPVIATGLDCADCGGHVPSLPPSLIPPSLPYTVSLNSSRCRSPHSPRSRTPVDFLEALLVLGSSRDAQWPPFLVHVLSPCSMRESNMESHLSSCAPNVSNASYMLYAARKLVRRTLRTVEARQLFHVHLGFGALLL